MMRGYFMPYFDAGYAGYGIFMPLIILLMIWTLIWKGLALWKSARRGDNYWFIALLLINTLGILEILYIYIFSEKTGSTVVEKAKEGVNKALK